jgi:cation:H+ antiporter
VTSAGFLLDLGAVVLGIVVLTAGAEGVVRGAAALARRLGVSALIVGLTVVAFGTSAPEVAVSVGASVTGRGDVALGNVVGSNIFNVLVILGISALITPLVVRRQLVRLDLPVMVGVSALPLLLGLDGRLSRGEGVLFLVLLGGYLASIGLRVVRERGVDGAENPFDDGEGGPLTHPWAVDVAFAAGGLVLLVVGASTLVDGAAGLARAGGVSELVIGLTVVAAGTSLPEVATSVVASLRGQRDLAVGNVVGSNIFNVLAVLGAAAVVAPAGLPVAAGVRTFDFPVMLAVALVCLPVFVTGARISRGEGAVLVLYYLFYLVYLGLHVTDHDFQQEFGVVVLGAVLPLTLALAGALWLQASTPEPGDFGDASEQHSGDATAAVGDPPDSGGPG